MHSGGSGLSIDMHFVDIELSYDVLSPLPIVLSKHFNHPHPYIEIATAISDDDSTASEEASSLVDVEGGSGTEQSNKTCTLEHIKLTDCDTGPLEAQHLSQALCVKDTGY